MYVSIFYLCSLIFLWVEIFQLRNRVQLLYLEIQEINPLKWIIFYVLKLFYFFWIFIGLFSSNYLIFATMMMMGGLKFLVLKTRNDYYINLYDLVVFITSISLLIYTSFLGVARLLL
jgi:hypothetical protein